MTRIPPSTLTLPECCHAPDGATLAHRLYAAYCRGQSIEMAGRENEDSPTLARWEDLSETRRQRWEAVAYERVCEDLTEEAQRLESDIAALAQSAGRGPVGKAYNVAATQIGLAIGMLLRAKHDGAAVGSG